jgi:phage gp36-like protein
MPFYNSLDDLLARYREEELIQLTDDAGAGTIDEVRIDQARASTAGIIEAHLAATYQLPLVRIPDVLIDVACDICRFKLYRDSPPELVEKNYGRAIDTLKAIAAGRVKIDAGAPEQAPRDGAILMGESDPLFTRDRMRGF